MNEEEALRALGNALRKTRQNRGLSQMALGELSELHRTYICDIERGTRNVTFLSLSKLAQALGSTVSEIIKLAEAATHAGNINNGSHISAPTLAQKQSFSFLEIQTKKPLKDDISGVDYK